MSHKKRRRVATALGIAAISAALLLGNSSIIPTSHAFTSQSPTATTVSVPVLPGSGFAEVAKTVTPAVVNITTITAEQVSDGSSIFSIFYKLI